MHIRFLAAALVAICAGGARADALDDLIRDEMKRREIPGLSIAIIDGGKIVRAQGYGVTEKGGKTAVTPSTLFQAGSVSKPVAALGALVLVEQGKLGLDEDVNTRLSTWKVPGSPFTADRKVTLRGLLSHTAGLTVHGFPGYATDAAVPSAAQVLSGTAPANTGPVQVAMAPGTKLQYSGGGYTVMQVLMAEASGKPFPQLMDDAVLKPLGMASSSYLQPPATGGERASGHKVNRSAVRGRWHVYPEMAAAGLWATPSDIARFAIGIQQAYAGSANTVISAAMARQMLTEQKDSVGLGLFLRGSGKARQFFHNGRNEGFDAAMTAFAETGQGVAIMINANDNSRMIPRIIAAVGRQYGWPDAAETVPASNAAVVKVAPKTLEQFAGRYQLQGRASLSVAASGNRLVTLVDGLPDEELVPVAPTHFKSASGPAELSFDVDAAGTVRGAIVRGKPAPRIAPLLHTLKPRQDTNPARAANVRTLLESAARGGTDVAGLAHVTPGIKGVLGSRRFDELSGLGDLDFLYEADMSAQPYERLGSKVAWVAGYKTTLGGTPQFLLVHLTADGLIADCEVVQN